MKIIQYLLPLKMEAYKVELEEELMNYSTVVLVYTEIFK